MKKIVVILVALMVTISACSIPKIVKVEQTAEPAAVQIETVTSPPTEVTALPTELPPVIPSPTPVPPTEEPDTEAVFTPGVVSGTEVVFEDDFSNSNLNWPARSTDRVSREFVDGEFYMNVITNKRIGWNYVPDVVYNHDVVLDVDVRGGTNFPEDSEAGFVCGFENGDNFFGMRLRADGEMDFFRELNDERESLYKASGLIPLNPEGTHLTGVCTQTEMSLYVNGRLIATHAIDGMPAGSAGLLGGANETGNVQLYFDNFTVSKGPYAAATDTIAAIPQRGSLLLFDDFSDESSGWDVRTIDNGSFTTYENGEYRMLVNEDSYDIWSNPNYDVITGNVIVEVDVRMGSNPGDGIAAIICNYNMTTNSDFTVIGIDGEGYGRIYDYVDKDVVELFKSQTPVALNRDINHLTVYCTGSMVTLLVNNQLIGSIAPGVPQADNVGLLAGTNEFSFADLYFDNFEVYSVR